MLARWAPEGERALMSTMIMAGSQVIIIIIVYVFIVIIVTGRDHRRLLCVGSAAGLAGLGGRVLHPGRGLPRLGPALAPLHFRHARHTPNVRREKMFHYSSCLQAQTQLYSIP